MLNDDDRMSSRPRKPTTRYGVFEVSFGSSSNSILRVTFSCQALIKTVQDIQEFSSPRSKNQWRKTRKSLQKKEPIEEEEEELSE